MTHPQVISNHCVKLELPIFLYKKDKNRTRIFVQTESGYIKNKIGTVGKCNVVFVGTLYSWVQGWSVSRYSAVQLSSVALHNAVHCSTVALNRRCLVDL